MRDSKVFYTEIIDGKERSFCCPEKEGLSINFTDEKRAELISRGWQFIPLA